MTKYKRNYTLNIYSQITTEPFEQWFIIMNAFKYSSTHAFSDALQFNMIFTKIYAMQISEIFNFRLLLSIKQSKKFFFNYEILYETRRLKTFQSYAYSANIYRSI